MKPIFEHNGLVWWSEEEIQTRRMVFDYFVRNVKTALLDLNLAWRFFECETPILMPLISINESYDTEDYFNLDDMALRPETTFGSYEVAKRILEQKNRLPICVYQQGKSFRNEQDKALSNMRLKEFWQLEFQCLYSITTANDYQVAMLPLLRDMFKRLLGNCEITESDRLPKYSLKTMDIIHNNMELASVSLRKDYKDDIRVLEIAIGLDRVVYHHLLTGGETK
jgi:glycyl-tRNA synthetase